MKQGALTLVALLTACGGSLHDPSISVTETFTPYASTRTLYESQRTTIFHSVLSICRVGLVRYARERGSNADESEKSGDYSQPLDDATAANWKSAVVRDSIVLEPGATFRVLGAVPYRCTYPLLVPSSANDVAMNGNESGGNGMRWRIEITSGSEKGITGLWEPDQNAQYADANEPCRPSDLRDPYPCDNWLRPKR